MDQNNQQPGGTPSPFFTQSNQNPAQPAAPTPIPPTPPTTPSPQAPAMSAPAPKHTHGMLIALVVVIVLAAVGGVGAYVYTGKRPEPKEVFKKSLMAMPTVQSFAFSLDVSGSGTTTPQPEIPFNTATFALHTEGKIDVHSDTDKKLDMNSTVKIHSGQNSDLFDMSASTEFMVLENKAYMQLKDVSVSYIPAKPNLQISAIIGAMQGAVASFKGQWVSFDVTDTSTPAKSTTDETKKAAEKLMAFDYIDSIETLPDETLAGVSTYHYLVTIDAAKFQSVVKDIEKTSTLLKGNQVAAAIVAHTSESTTEHPVFEISIGKKDSLVYRLALHETSLKDQPSNSTATFKGEITFSQYNAAMDVVAPAKSMTIEEFQQQLMGSIMQPPRGATTTKSSPSTTVKTRTQ